MKIGILTLPLYYNYGGIMQAYALQKCLNELGHESTIINYPFKIHEPSNYIIAKRIVKKILGKDIGYYVDFERRYNKWLPRMKSHTDSFIRKYIKLSSPLKSYNEIQESDYDAIVVGSDQIWRPCMFQNDPAIAFLSFAEKWKIKRVSYGASFGTDVWEYTESQTVRCRELANLFDAISVRETSGVKMCHEILGIEAVQVCDPTLLLDQELYYNLIQDNNTPISEGSLFNYTLDITEAKSSLITFIANEKNLIPFKVNATDNNIYCPIEDRIARPVESWLRAFHDASFVVTDSFHACVFSIIFRKPFVAFANKERGLARFESLLGPLGLIDRLVENISDYKKIPSDIDYDVVGVKLLKLRDKSLSFLINTFSYGC